MLYNCSEEDIKRDLGWFVDGFRDHKLRIDSITKNGAVYDVVTSYVPPTPAESISITMVPTK